jgi:hypothetical protein
MVRDGCPARGRRDHPARARPQIGLSPAAASAAVSVLKVVFCLALVGLYAAIAVLKYRLYDIDRVISRRD